MPVLHFVCALLVPVARKGRATLPYLYNGTQRQPCLLYIARVSVTYTCERFLVTECKTHVKRALIFHFNAPHPYSALCSCSLQLHTTRITNTHPQSASPKRITKTTYNTQTNAEDLATKYATNPSVASCKRYTKLKRPQTGFAIDHYAGSGVLGRLLIVP